MPQILLTQEEYTTLVNRPTPDKITELVDAVTVLREAILDAHKIICVKDRTTKEGYRNAHYCDGCPVGKLVQSTKNYKTLCPRADDWSK